jgi:outer membrane protein TolC
MTGRYSCCDSARTLSTRRSALNFNRDQLLASVDLIRALGGGWEEPTPAQNANTMDTRQHG